MSSVLFSVPHSMVTFNTISLAVLAILIRIYLKGLKICLPFLIKKNKVRCHIQDLSTLLCGFILILCLVIFFAPIIKTFAIPLSMLCICVALSFQTTIACVVGRIIILVTRLYQVGDHIQIGVLRGDVVSIGLMRTFLMESQNKSENDQCAARIVQVSNATVLKENVINYSDQND
ncbi:MAG: Transporter, MscS family [uncultured bacterium]|nr:MAG: Transporter, MscS family [uncultured bacterium]OGT58349.1 MAG: hypothetical protein A3F43_02130 [Gammaproteobacteria bacterium RIFCSPHIGHO2_12_FULL_42_10]